MYAYSGAAPLQMCPSGMSVNNIVQTANITINQPHNALHYHSIYPMTTTPQVLCLCFNFTYRVVCTVNKVVYMEYNFLWYMKQNPQLTVSMAPGSTKSKSKGIAQEQVLFTKSYIFGNLNFIVCGQIQGAAWVVDLATYQ